MHKEHIGKMSNAYQIKKVNISSSNGNFHISCNCSKSFSQENKTFLWEQKLKCSLQRNSIQNANLLWVHFLSHRNNENFHGSNEVPKGALILGIVQKNFLSLRLRSINFYTSLIAGSLAFSPCLFFFILTT